MSGLSLKGTAAQPPVRLAVVGLGYWGPNLVRNAYELPAAEVNLICDLHEPVLDAIGSRYPGVARTLSFDQVIADETIDAVVIATPVSTHYRLAKAALEAGKHVLVEKPLAASYAQALELVELARVGERVLMPGHTFLYSPSVLMIKELIDSGDLGEIYFISSSRVNLGLYQPDVSVLWDLAPHDFSILRFWLDEVPSHVSALSRACVLPGMSDVAFVNLEFRSGSIAHVELSWLSPSKLRRTTVVGSRKMVVYDDTSGEPVRVFDSGVANDLPQTFGEHQLAYRLGDIVSPRVEPFEPLLLELADFCAAVQTGSRPRSDARFGLDVVQMVEAASMSVELGSRRIACSDDERDSLSTELIEQVSTSNGRGHAVGQAAFARKPEDGWQ